MLPKNVCIFSAKRSLSIANQSSKLASVSVRKQSVWTSDNVINSPYKDIEIPKCTLYDYVWQNLEKWPQRTIAVCSTTGRGYTYEQAFKLSNTFAANLRLKFRIQDGDAIAVMLPNIPDYPLVAMGIIEAGGVITSINPIYTANEVHKQLLLSDAKVIVTLPSITNTVKEALKLAKLNIPVIVVKTNGEATPAGTVVFNELSEDVNVDTSCLKKVRRSPDDICFLPYSSGTTGFPKGVELTSRNLIANCEQINVLPIKSHNDTTATHQDAVMTVLPLFHIYAANVIMFHKMSLGIKMVTLAKFQPDTFFQAIEKYRTNLIYVAPPLVLLMASHPMATAESLRSLETVVNGAAPLSSTDADRFFHKIQRKLDFRQGYGLTETSPTVAFSEKNSVNYSCVGNAVPNTSLKIIDPEDKALGPNETGELLVKGPQVMKGYRGNPESNQNAFTSDGWFKTGDLAVADENGVVRIADRLKELIKVKGFQVPPAELEAVIREHPGVEDTAVVGIPHPTNGEAPKAFIVLKKGVKAKEQELKDFIKERVASYKKVEEIMFLENIPKSSAGKILRKDLKQKYC